MITHFILMSSSYYIGKRIVLDLTNVKDVQTFRQIIQSVKKECGNDVSITTHIIETDSKKFDSVKKVDRFFNDVYLVKNLNEFIKLVRKDRKLEAMDVAKYILT